MTAKTAATTSHTGRVDVAFITVNYNTRALLEDLVVFFRETPLPFSYELIVVDNASGDGSLEFLESCPEVAVVRNGENLGYGRAMNRGISASRARYLCLMNTDVILNREALAALVTHCDNHAEVQLASPVIRYENGRIQGFFFKFGLLTLYFDLYKKLCNKAFKRKVAHAKGAIPVDGIAGAFIFCRRGLAVPGPLFDEDFFFYYEDTELAHRLMRQGARCEVLPQVSVIHLGGGSSSLRHLRLFYAGKYRYVRKMHGVLHAKAVFLQDVARVSVKRLFYGAALLVAPTEHLRSKGEAYRFIATVLKEIRAAELTR